MADGAAFTQRVHKVLAAANAESARLQHEYIGTEHILLGLARDREGVAIAVLRQLGVDPASIPGVIESLVKKGRASATDVTDRPYTSRAKRALELARTAAATLGHSYVGTEHILIGLLDEERGIAAQLLGKLGVTADGARRETLRLLGTPPP